MIAAVPPSDAFALAEARGLFAEYAAALGPGHLCMQSFERELASLPGDYASPTGGLWLARVDEALAGCVALRYGSAGIAELKRLYVRPAFRGLCLGRALAEHAIAEARNLGYSRVRLDTLPSMTEAVRLYRILGFRTIAAYHDNSVAGALFFELVL